MRFGRCEWILKKNNRGDFTRSLIENVFLKAGFSLINPHLNCVDFFDDMGEENTCGENEFILNACNMYKIIDVTFWKDYGSIEICFDITDENYDIFELNINLMDEEELNRLITGITALILNSNFDLKGIIFDKYGILRELSYDSADERFVDFAFDEKSDIRQKLLKSYSCITRVCEEIEFPLFIKNNIGNIFIYNFLCNGAVKVDLFELR